MGAKPLDLEPGGTLAIRVADYIDKIEAYLKPAGPLSAITRCNFFIASSEFDDGLRYAAGAYSVPDSHRPGQWVYYRDRSYFPGDAHRYLPNVVRRVGEPPQS